MHSISFVIQHGIKVTTKSVNLERLESKSKIQQNPDSTIACVIRHSIITKTFESCDYYHFLLFQRIFVLQPVIKVVRFGMVNKENQGAELPQLMSEGIEDQNYPTQRRHKDRSREQKRIPVLKEGSRHKKRCCHTSCQFEGVEQPQGKEPP
jgi:hypothetical protein